jgi:hypothetical protein
MSETPIVPHPWPGAAPEITLRDWFAGQALVGLISSEYREFYEQATAFDAYEIADAMLAERAKRSQS